MQKWHSLEEGVFILLSESTEAERPGYTTSERVIDEHLSQTFFEAPGRILVAVYASNFIRIQQVFKNAQESMRKVALVGKSLEKVVHLGVSLGYLDLDEDSIIPPRHSQIWDNEIIVLVTGNQGEPLEALEKLFVNIKNED